MDSIDITGNHEADGLYKVTKKSDYSVRLKLQRKVTVTELTQVISVSTQRRAKKTLSGSFRYHKRYCRGLMKE